MSTLFDAAKDLWRTTQDHKVFADSLCSAFAHKDLNKFDVETLRNFALGFETFDGLSFGHSCHHRLSDLSRNLLEVLDVRSRSNVCLWAGRDDCMDFVDYKYLDALFNSARGDTQEDMGKAKMWRQVGFRMQNTFSESLMRFYRNQSVARREDDVIYLWIWQAVFNKLRFLVEAVLETCGFDLSVLGRPRNDRSFFARLRTYFGDERPECAYDESDCLWASRYVSECSLVGSMAKAWRTGDNDDVKLLRGLETKQCTMTLAEYSILHDHMLETVLDKVQDFELLDSDLIDHVVRHPHILRMLIDKGRVTNPVGLLYQACLTNAESVELLLPLCREYPRQQLLIFCTHDSMSAAEKLRLFGATPEELSRLPWFFGKNE